MKTEDLLKLYQLVLDEEHHYNEAHQSRIAFHMGLITAIFTGIGAGFFLASDWYHFLALCSDPVISSERCLYRQNTGIFYDR